MPVRRRQAPARRRPHRRHPMPRPSKFGGRSNLFVHSLERKIKAIVNRGEETKYLCETILDKTASGYTNFNSVITTASDWYRMLPTLAQGAAMNQRIGNKIAPVRATTQWNITFDATTEDANSRDIFVVLYVVKPRFQRSYGSSTTAVNGQMTDHYGAFIENGNGGDQGFNGVWADSQKPINNDSFTLLKKKVVRLFKPTGLQNTNRVFDPAGPTVGGTISAPEKYRATLSYSCKPPRLHYDQTSAHQPANYSPFWALGYFYADGTAADTSGGILAVDCLQHLWFKDV